MSRESFTVGRFGCYFHLELLAALLGFSLCFLFPEFPNTTRPGGTSTVISKVSTWLTPLISDGSGLDQTTDPKVRVRVLECCQDTGPL